MVAVVVMSSGGSVVNSVSLMFVCLALCVGAHVAAPKIHALAGWRKVAANIAMTFGALYLLAFVASPQLILAKTAVMMECVCYWGWESWCCYF